MYIVINSWASTQFSVSSFAVVHPSDNPPPRQTPPKFVSTLNCKIFENLKKLLHSFVEMSKFYLNIQYSRILVRNFLS